MTVGVTPKISNAIMAWNILHQDKQLLGNYSDMKISGLGKTIFLSYNRQAQSYYLKEFNWLERKIRFLMFLIKSIAPGYLTESILDLEHKKALKALVLSLPLDETQTKDSDDEKKSYSTESHMKILTSSTPTIIIETLDNKPHGHGTIFNKWDQLKCQYVLAVIPKILIQNFPVSKDKANHSNSVIADKCIEHLLYQLDEDTSTSCERKVLNGKTRDILELFKTTSKLNDHEKRKNLFKSLETAYVEYTAYLKMLTPSQNALAINILKTMAIALFTNEIPHTVYKKILADFVKDLPTEGQEDWKVYFNLPDVKIKSSHPVQDHSRTLNFDLVEGVRQFMSIISGRKTFLQKTYEKFSKICNRTFIGFTPLRESNLSSVIYFETYHSHGHDFGVKCLRFGTPTRDNKIVGKRASTPDEIKPLKILEEFRLFLDVYKENEIIHLYFNHQKYVPNAIIYEDESERVAEIHRLQNDYKETLFIFDLPLDGEFFLQTKNKGTLLKDDFIQQFKLEINDTQRGRNESHLQDAVERRSEEHQGWFNESIDLVATLFFSRKNELSVEERIAFQLISYITIEERMICEMHPVSYNSSCKDAIDRAGVVNGLRFYLYLLKSNKENDIGSIKNFFEVLLWPALLVHGNSLREDRFEPLEYTLNYLLTLSSEEKKMIRQCYEKMKYSLHLPGEEKNATYTENNLSANPITVPSEV